MSVIVLLTGLVVVFAALIVLTFIIKGYGAAVTAVLNGKKKNVAEKAAAKPAPAPSAPAVSDGIPGEVIAAIAAAVDYTFGSGTHVVRSVRRVPQNRSAWGSAGLVENTRPF